MRPPLKYLLFLTLILLFSCDKSVLFVQCSDCTKEEPKTAVIEITINESAITNNQETTINIYSGNLEDNVLLVTFKAGSTEPTYTATINKQYTITATYIINGISYNVVGSIYPRVRYVTKQCTEPCYYIYDKKVNLKLKYT